MKSKRAFLSAIALFGITILSLLAIQTENLSGTWNGKMHIPNFGPYEMTMVLEKTDSGYEGTVSDTMGYIAEDTPMQELQVENNQLSCWFEMTDDSTCYLNLAEEDGIMIGEAERDGGVVSCVFVREK
ncbi:MAG: hypothetical protein JSV17_06775 [Candidatus Aminicenantes bacterium]|nr:MAG: hypothetical protein JSV17_06775 [Candidatus Aminicenantes bacterium]